MAAGPELPRFIAPMVAKPGKPFDSESHLFEIKWDGTRTLAFIDQDGYRLVNRRRVNMTDRYPELAFLRTLAPGTVLDGEMIVFKNGKPDFSLLMSREQSRSTFKIRSLARALPATYLVIMFAIQVIDDPAAATVALEPVRSRLLSELGKSCRPSAGENGRTSPSLAGADRGRNTSAGVSARPTGESNAGSQPHRCKRRGAAREVPAMSSPGSCR
jgi:ATP-dependent DNA ligase